MIEVRNAHGNFSVSGAVMDRLVGDHQGVGLQSLQNALASIIGAPAEHYSDVTSRVEVLVMIGATLERSPLPRQ